MPLRASDVLETNPDWDLFHIVQINPRLGMLETSEDPETAHDYTFLLKAPPDQPDPQGTESISVTTQLCSNCHGALSYFTQCIKKSRDQDHRGHGYASACTVHQNHSSLVSGARADCHLCRLIFTSLYRYKKSMRVLEDTAIEMSWSPKYAAAKETESRTHNGQNNAMTLELTLIKTKEERSTESCWNFMRLHSSNSANPSEKALPKTSSTGSDGCRDLALQWLARCRKNLDGRHDQCNQKSPQYLPTRLLDVEGALRTSCLKLVTQSHAASGCTKDEEYITLSHCWGVWGRTGLPSLTTGNKTEREQNGISLDQLPITFRDAIVVASWFGVKWIWIDSFCIIQDSKEDWQYEALQMAKVYRNALLNISADSSVDARGGCFAERNALSYLPIQVSYVEEGKAKGFSLSFDEPGVFDGMTKSPLAERGWVFQERQLSRRVLHFMDTEIGWECCALGDSFACELYPRGGSFRRPLKGKPKFQSQGELGQLEHKSIIHMWNTLCIQYSEKTLSYAKDKTIALSGLAQEFLAALQRDSYVAGMWKSTLPFSLLWTAGPSSKGQPDNTYVAPSWSWLSLLGPIVDMGGGSDGKSRPLAGLVGIDLDLVDPSEPTGSLRGGSMTLSGCLRRVTIEPDYDEKPWYLMAIGGLVMHRLIIHDSRRTITAGQPMTAQDPYAPDAGELSVVHATDFAFSFDDKSPIKNKQAQIPCYFLPLAINDAIDPVSGSVAGLLLEGTAEANKYRRIGVLTISGSFGIPMRYRLDADYRGDEKDVYKAWRELEKALINGYNRDDVQTGTILDTDAKPVQAESTEQHGNAGARSLDLWFSRDSGFNDSRFARVASCDVVIV